MFYLWLPEIRILRKYSETHDIVNDKCPTCCQGMIGKTYREMLMLGKCFMNTV